MSDQRPRPHAVRPRSSGRPRVTLRLLAVALLGASLLSLSGPGATLATTGQAPAAAPAVAQTSTPAPKGLTGEVYGFLPYWEIDSGVDAYLRYDLLTTIALFAVYYDASGNLDTTTLLGSGRADLISTIVQHAHAQGVRVDLTLRPSNDTASANQAFFANAPAQAAAIANMAAQVASLGLDGANIDIESLYNSDFAAYGAFGAALRASLVKADAAARVTVSTNANVSGSGMAAQAISDGVDRAFLMGYNYRGATSSPVGSISPLVSSVDGLSLSWSIGQYDKLDVPRDRIILGLPYYGMTWPTTSGLLHATRSGTGVAFFPTDSLPPPSGTTINYDAVERAAWFAVQDPTTKAWSETYFDDETSLRAKYGLAVTDGLAGVGMWALGYDAGQPGYWEAIASTFGVLRLAGADRYGTAVAVSANLLQPGAGTVIVASGLGFADALGGSAAAGHLGGSLLLTAPTALPASVALELSRADPANVIVLGGKSVVSDAVLDAIQARLPHATVTRVGGSDRYATAADLSKAVYPGGASTVFIASGANYPDGLAGGAEAARLGAPLLLSDPARLSPATRTELQRLAPTTVYLLGSTASLSSAVATAVSTALPSATVNRLGGDDRYATAVAISGLQDPGVPVVYVAAGTNFPDGLTGSAAAGELGGPLLLTQPGGLPVIVATELARLEPRRVVVLGGTSAVSDAVVAQLRGYLALP
ncbi:MAG TPA: cell wall-binding repeat-containing protein [Candidatus Sulfotelmatobacter sp.]|nr:cell wall-binding repeat-containing protein [Candidatus Sulfotelmatobacter sp.]